MKTKAKVFIPSGFRLLVEGETIQAGDKFCRVSGEWVALTEHDFSFSPNKAVKWKSEYAFVIRRDQ